MVGIYETLFYESNQEEDGEHLPDLQTMVKVIKK